MKTLRILALGLFAVLFLAGCSSGSGGGDDTPELVPVTGVTLDRETLYLAAGDTTVLSASVAPENASDQTLIWSATPGSVATVDQSGLVTAVSEGTATITVITRDGEHTDSCTVTVTSDPVPATGITLDRNTLALNVDETYQLTANLTPENASYQTLIWSACPDSVATVNSNGLVTALAEGTATITVTTEDGSHTDSCTVTVTTVAVTGVSLDRETLALNISDTFQLTPALTPENATNRNIGWSTDEASVATVDQNGLVTALAEGSAVITVTTEDGDHTDSCTVTVTRIAVTGVTIDEERKILHSGSYQLEAEVFPADATYPEVTWTSSDNTVATVDENGMVTAVGTGITLITVRTTDGSFTDVCQLIVCDETDFVSLWDMSLTTTNTLSVPLINGDFNFTIFWGDGSQESISSNTATHDYSSGNTFTVIISGLCDGFGFSLSTEQNEDNLVNILQWGDVGFHSLGYWFADCSNLSGFSAEDMPDLSGVTSMNYVFSNAESFNGDISGWDVSSITHMSGLFSGAASFNGDISQWNTSAVINMLAMFRDAVTFNADISNWDVSSVTNMNQMFYGATSFNRDLSAWGDKTGSVTYMERMFMNAEVFNGNISTWDTSSVRNMANMFRSAGMFNGDISDWNTSSVTDMNSMFYNAVSFNGDISDWDTSHVTNMANMFRDAVSFNSDISLWNVSRVENMSAMFTEASSFNRDLSQWNVAAVESMDNMFLLASNYNNGGNPGGLEGWNVLAGCNTYNMFLGCAIDSSERPSWYD